MVTDGPETYGLVYLTLLGYPIGCVEQIFYDIVMSGIRSRWSTQDKPARRNKPLFVELIPRGMTAYSLKCY